LGDGDLWTFFRGEEEEKRERERERGRERERFLMAS